MTGSDWLHELDTEPDSGNVSSKTRRSSGMTVPRHVEHQLGILKREGGLGGGAQLIQTVAVGSGKLSGGGGLGAVARDSVA